LGPIDAKVTVVEFGDFECPACGALHPLLQQLKANNKDTSVRFVYRHFPLSQHPNAQLAAEASVEAAQQGKFWEFHDQLFTHQNDLDRASLEEYAQAVGLDINAFKKALDENTHRAFVIDDQSDGEAARVNSTPTVFINGIKFTGQFTVAGLQAAIDEHLK
jgi:protein-disulfide isomerase